MAHRHHQRSHYERMLFANPQYVRGLQTELQALGLYKQTASGVPLPIDGIAGEETRKALQEWAGLHGGDVDGILGSKSLHAIYEKLHTPPQDPVAQTLARKLRRAYAHVRQEHSAPPQAPTNALTIPYHALAPPSGHPEQSLPPQPPPAQPQASGLPPLCVGDSITDGVRSAGHFNGDIREASNDPLTKWGRHPKEILAIIAKYRDQLRGRDIILSTGMSNSPDLRQLAVVREEIAALREAGVGRIMIMGVGERDDYQRLHLNTELANIATSTGSGFTGPLGQLVHLRDNHVYSDHFVHPDGPGFAHLAKYIPAMMRTGTPIPPVQTAAARVGATFG